MGMFSGVVQVQSSYKVGDLRFEYRADGTVRVHEGSQGYYIQLDNARVLWDRLSKAFGGEMVYRIED